MIVVDTTWIRCVISCVIDDATTVEMQLTVVDTDSATTPTCTVGFQHTTIHRELTNSFCVCQVSIYTDVDSTCRAFCIVVADSTTVHYYV